MRELVLSAYLWSLFSVDGILLYVINIEHGLRLGLRSRSRDKSSKRKV